MIRTRACRIWQFPWVGLVLMTWLKERERTMRQPGQYLKNDISRQSSFWGINQTYQSDRNYSSFTVGSIGQSSFRWRGMNPPSRLNTSGMIAGISASVTRASQTTPWAYDMKLVSSQQGRWVVEGIQTCCHNSPQIPWLTLDLWQRRPKSMANMIPISRTTHITMLGTLEWKFSPTQPSMNHIHEALSCDH